ncbi:Protein of uncharacterised function (DUF2946) [Leminorella richardii]|uniref:Protein of uncharacterized function (DUF2946) n=1 Tax=Leminorella richardii TaxID=158841 RepID=A0A2X4VDR9_9GAMM|nr:DUF2946 domain-containing protein [Leminorella richardii]SQI43420.1 Protein of uncharacterised function (DUF2946) [Leminorella richardii]
MRSLPRSRAAAFIALAAMLMLFIAPLISKSLAQVAACHQSAQHVSMNAPMEGVSVSVADTSEAHGKHGGTHPDMAMSHGGQSLLEDIACGYCHILIHLSLILVIVQPLIWLLFFVFQSPPVGDLLCLYLSKSYRKNLARAPPPFAFSF